MNKCPPNNTLDIEFYFAASFLGSTSVTVVCVWLWCVLCSSRGPRDSNPAPPHIRQHNSEAVKCGGSALSPLHSRPRSNVTCTVLPRTCKLASHFTPMCVGSSQGKHCCLLGRQRGTQTYEPPLSAYTQLRPILSRSKMAFKCVAVIFSCLSSLSSLIVLHFPSRCLGENGNK